jgi:hypothetical protein
MRQSDIFDEIIGDNFAGGGASTGMDEDCPRRDYGK